MLERVAEYAPNTILLLTVTPAEPTVKPVVVLLPTLHTDCKLGTDVKYETLLPPVTIPFELTVTLLYVLADTPLFGSRC